MDDLRFYVLLNSISDLAGQWEFYNERFFAMKSRLRLERFPPSARLEPGTARSVGQHLTYWATAAPWWWYLCHQTSYGIEFPPIVAWKAHATAGPLPLQMKPLCLVGFLTFFRLIRKVITTRSWPPSMLSAPEKSRLSVAQWDRRWPAELAAHSSIPADVGKLSNRKLGSSA